MAMSDEHKAALAEGRRQAAAIKRYLSGLRSRRPGRPVTPDSLREKIARLEDRLADEADPLRRVDLRQAIRDTQEALQSVANPADLEALEAGFVQYAAAYSDRKGIGYLAWREEGVPAAVLKRAGIKRTR